MLPCHMSLDFSTEWNLDKKLEVPSPIKQNFSSMKLNSGILIDRETLFSHF
uniref:Uncharacterized protein n=1 Tax=Rhizophora mucronata TaxID=61149 RepID=A0A2P2QLI0_RHIMU